ncbi:MAG: CHAT domain-containing protein [Bryobacter sp.]|jgi:CHAT domain-containing protein|nr:CHAT domain-containing protein [Bryobacter sp. CoA8 C33]
MLQETRFLYFGILILLLGGCKSPTQQVWLNETYPAGKAPPPKLSALKAEAYQKTVEQNYETAIDLYQQARSEARLSGDTKLLVQLTNNLAGCHQAISSYREAMRYYSEALELARKNGLRELENTAALNVASILLEMGEIAGAARVVNRYPEDGSHIIPSVRLQGLMLLASIRARLKDHDGAHRAFLLALTEADRDPPPAVLAAYQHTIGKWPESARELRRAYAMAMYSQLLLHEGRFEAAEKYCLEAYRIRATYRDQNRLREVLHLAMVERGRKRFPEAIRLLATAQALDPGNRSPMLLFLLDRERARIELARGSFSGSLPYLRSALRRARSWRMEVLPANSTFLNFEANLDSEIQHAFLDILARNDFNLNQSGVAEESLQIAEEARFGSMRAAQWSQTQFAGQLDSTYWAKLARFQQLQTLSAAGKPVSPHELADLEHHLKMAEIAVGLELPRPEAVGSGQISSWLRRLPGDETLFSYYLSEPNSLVWIVRRGQVTVHRLAGRAKLGKLIEEFSRALVSRSPAQCSRSGMELSRQLFGDFSRSRPTTPFWTMVIDQDLAKLAFAALPSPENPSRYLVEDKTLRFLPSAMMLGRDSAWSWTPSITGFVDPVYNTADERGKTKALLGLNRLVASAREWEQTGAIFERRHWRRFSRTGAEATPANLRNALGQSSGILHISAHVISQGSGAQSTQIALSPNGSSDEAGLFGLEDLNSVRTTAKLVVLSGCASAQGVSHSGIAINSLARAFLISGASNVLATLWPLQDTDGPLFPLFYQHVLDRPGSSRDVASALRHAQLQLLQRSDWSARPVYWASFILLGKG